MMSSISAILSKSTFILPFLSFTVVFALINIGYAAAFNVSSGTNKNFTLSALISNLTASPKSISIEFTFFINSLFLNLVSSTFCISSFNLLE